MYFVNLKEEFVDHIKQQKIKGVYIKLNLQPEKELILKKYYTDYDFYDFLDQLDFLFDLSTGCLPINVGYILYDDDTLSVYREGSGIFNNV